MAEIINFWCVLAVRDLQVSTSYYMNVLGFGKEPIDAAGWSFLDTRQIQTDARRM